MRRVEQAHRGADADRGIGWPPPGEGPRRARCRRASPPRSTTEPTERSIPPTSTTSVMARPSTSTEADWRMMLTALPGVPKTGEVATNRTTSSTSATSIAFRDQQGAQRRHAPLGAGGVERGDHAAAAPWIIRFRCSSLRSAGRRLGGDGAVADDEDAVGQRQHLGAGRSRRATIALPARASASSRR